MGDNRGRISYLLGISNKKCHSLTYKVRPADSFKLSYSRNRLGKLETWQFIYHLKTLLKSHFHVLQIDE